MSDRDDFYRSDVFLMEEMLSEHELGAFFTGRLYVVSAAHAIEPLESLELPDLGDGPLILDPLEVGRLFFAPDGSLVDFCNVNEDDFGAPAGFSVYADSHLAQEGQFIQVIAYREDVGGSLILKNLHIRRMMLEQYAPDRFATVGFGLMAATAYKLGFAEITLFAGGRGPIRRAESDDLVGYAVWPKLGFDAPLSAVDLQRAPVSTRSCNTVLDVVLLAPDWWADHGSGRPMTFDLRPQSRSWHILLNYLYRL